MVVVATAAPGPTADVPVAAGAPPIEGRFNVDFGVDSTWYTQKGFDLFSDSDVAHSLAVDVGYAVYASGPISVVPELGFSTNSQSSGALFGGAITSTSLDTNAFHAGASVRYALLSFLEPEARVTGGFSLVHAKLNPSGGPSELESNSTIPFVTLGGGITVHTPTGTFETKQSALRRLVLGVTVEGGAVLASSMELTPTPTQPSGRITTVDQSLGSLGRSGPFVRVVLGLRF